MTAADCKFGPPLAAAKTMSAWPARQRQADASSRLACCLVRDVRHVGV